MDAKNLARALLVAVCPIVLSMSSNFAVGQYPTSNMRPEAAVVFPQQASGYTVVAPGFSPAPGFARPGAVIASSNMPMRAMQNGPRPGVTPIRTANFVILCNDPSVAQQVADAAEKQRKELSMYWLGREIPQWPQPCPITVKSGPRMPAGGATTFTPGNRAIHNWRMNVTGTPERILDSVLPHEITHTILATHFAPTNKVVPRWADEGACTTVEHQSERSKHDKFLVEFLSTGRGIPFATMFTLKEYPEDIMPLYAQGYSVASFLIAQGGPQKFVSFLGDGMTTDDWVRATEKHYDYQLVGRLQTAWNQWVYDGGGKVDNHTAIALSGGKNITSVAEATPSPVHSDAPVAVIASNESLNESNTSFGFGKRMKPLTLQHDPPSMEQEIR